MWLLRVLRKPMSTMSPQPVLPGILKGQDEFIKVHLSEVLPISENTKIFRFELPQEDQQLGLPVCKHLFLRAKVPTKQCPEGELTVRKYTPISAINEKGFFDLLIKIYYKNLHPEYPEGALFTQFIDSLKIGDSIEIAGPTGRIEYYGDGVFKIKQNETETIKKAKNIGMIAGGTGITPCFQVLQYSISQNENVNLSLIYANKTENDILLRPILEEFIAEQVVHTYFVLEKPPENWKMGVGYITHDHIVERMPPPHKDTLILYCGPSSMNVHVRNLLSNIGYTPDMVLKF